MTNSIKSYHELPEAIRAATDAATLITIRPDGKKQRTEEAVDDIDYAYYTRRGRYQRSAQVHRLIGYLWRALKKVIR